MNPDPYWTERFETYRSMGEDYETSAEWASIDLASKTQREKAVSS